MKEKRVPKRPQNLNPKWASRTLRHARNYVMKNHRDWAQFPGDVSVAADVNQLLLILQSKVMLGVDKIEA
jgi:hypothetical protein